MLISKKKIIIIILTVIVFVNTYFLAKYISSFEGSDSTELAKWSVSYDTDDNISDTINLISGDGAKDYYINITSNSEVALKYSIILNNVPDEMEVKIDDKGFEYPTNNKIIFDIGYFSASDLNSTKQHILSFNAPLDSEIASSTNVDIDIIFDQID